MRVLIADDEYLVRTSLKSMLEELKVPLDFAGEATNGEEMVALAGQYLPDVAFVDIRMPRLNGLEAIKRGKKVSPHTRWYVLTGFPEFDYAQEAIRLGVSGYLLKPVNPEELQKIFGELIEENQNRKAAQNKQFEHELMKLSYGLSSLEFESPESILVKAHFIGAIFYIDSHLPEKAKAERQFEFCRTVQASIEDCLDNLNRIALFVLPGGELATVGAWEPTQDHEAEMCVREFFKAVERDVRKSSDEDLAITVLISKECLTYPDLQTSLERLQEISPLRVLAGIGRKLELTLLNQLVRRPALLELSNMVLNLSHYFQEGKSLSYMKALQDLEKYLTKSNLSGKRLFLNAMPDFFQRSVHCKLVPGQEFKRWIAVLRQHGELMLKGAAGDETFSRDMINQVTSFVDDNYMLDIGIGQIAEQLNITPNYLSTLFHKKTGTNFMSYLKNVRLFKAKELLTGSNIQIQQVAEQVGYLSTRHFARLFSEQFGCLPSEYRDSFKKH